MVWKIQMTAFEPQTSGVKSNCSANFANMTSYDNFANMTSYDKYLY